jgi:uncharacterized protein YndB with AHSA1/START domain
MKTLHFSVRIEAPREKVWRTMLNDRTYRQWTEVFSAGSHFVGNWEKGSKILFLAPDKNGKMAGMVSTIAENRPNEFISIKHLGVVSNGVEDTVSKAVKNWSGALENYTFQEKNGGTEVIIDTDSDDEFESMFKEIWPRALDKLKELAEKS